MSEKNWITKTVAPKSDQLNAEDLIAGAKTVTIEDVTENDDVKQPASVHIAGHQPWKPCKTMRRVLIAMWGGDSDAWVGRQLTLIVDPKVVYGGEVMGGVRVSHASHLDKPFVIKLTETRGKRVAIKILPLQQPKEKPVPTLAERVKTAVEAYDKCNDLQRLSVLDKHVDALHADADDEQKKLISAAKDAATERVNANA